MREGESAPRACTFRKKADDNDKFKIVVKIVGSKIPSHHFLFFSKHSALRFWRRYNELRANCIVPVLAMIKPCILTSIPINHKDDHKATTGICIVQTQDLNIANRIR
jgi:hypothetical protein